MQSNDYTNVDNLYVVDTSSLLDAKLWYGRVRGFWDFFGNLILNGKILIPEAVKAEIDIGRSDDFIKKFLNNYKHKIFNFNDQILKIIEMINEDHGGYYSRHKNEYADAHVVATAIYHKKQPRLDAIEIYVISQESLNSKNDYEEKVSKGEIKPKIPNLCRKYEINHINLYRLLDMENKDI